MSPWWCSEQWCSTIRCDYALAPLAYIKCNSIVLDVIEFHGPEQLIADFVPIYISRKFGSIVTTEGQLGLGFEVGGHIESEHVLLENFLQHHVVENRGTESGHFGIGKTDNGIVISIEETFLNNETECLISEVNRFITLTSWDSEVIKAKEAWKSTWTKLNSFGVSSIHIGTWVLRGKEEIGFGIWLASVRLAVAR